MRAKQGFSLIELLIVVSIILVIAAIAIPSLLRSRIAANESAAAAALRSINVAEATFASTYNSGYSEDLRRLGAPSSGSATVTAADLLDQVLSANAPGNTGRMASSRAATRSSTHRPAAAPRSALSSGTKSMPIRRLAAARGAGPFIRTSPRWCGPTPAPRPHPATTPSDSSRRASEACLRV